MAATGAVLWGPGVVPGRGELAALVARVAAGREVAVEWEHPTLGWREYLRVNVGSTGDA